MARSRDNCREPPNHREQLSSLYAGLLHFNSAGTGTFNIIPEFRSSYLNNPIRTYSKKKRQHLFGSAVCDSNIQSLRLKQRLQYATDNLYLTSTCPWYVKMEYDANRLPHVIAKAECVCEKCYNVMNSDTAGKCNKVNSFIPVIRRKCLSGVYMYFATVETVPVGCTCKRNVGRSKRRKLSSIQSFI